MWLLIIAFDIIWHRFFVFRSCSQYFHENYNNWLIYLMVLSLKSQWFEIYLSASEKCTFQINNNFVSIHIARVVKKFANNICFMICRRRISNVNVLNKQQKLWHDLHIRCWYDCSVLFFITHSNRHSLWMLAKNNKIKYTKS